MINSTSSSVLSSAHAPKAATTNPTASNVTLPPRPPPNLRLTNILPTGSVDPQEKSRATESYIPVSANDPPINNPVPNPGPAPGPPASPSPGTFASRALEVHNLYRSWHGAAPLEWDEGLAAWSADYARKCKWGHSQRPGVGENLAIVFPSVANLDGGQVDPGSMITAWYGEWRGYRDGVSRLVRGRANCKVRREDMGRE